MHGRQQVDAFQRASAGPRRRRAVAHLCSDSGAVKPMPTVCPGVTHQRLNLRQPLLDVGQTAGVGVGIVELQPVAGLAQKSDTSTSRLRRPLAAPG
ncbi:hypothetical protein ACVBEH_05910 [Roseateles sp. GG27B]